MSVGGHRTSSTGLGPAAQHLGVQVDAASTPASPVSASTPASMPPSAGHSPASLLWLARCASHAFWKVCRGEPQLQTGSTTPMHMVGMVTHCPVAAAQLATEQNCPVGQLPLTVAEHPAVPESTSASVPASVEELQVPAARQAPKSALPDSPSSMPVELQQISPLLQSLACWQGSFAAPPHARRPRRKVEQRALSATLERKCEVLFVMTVLRGRRR